MSSLYVRWLSSETVREAVVKFWQLRHRINQQAANALLSYKPNQYAIAIDPLVLFSEPDADVQSLIKAREDQIRQSAYLEFNPGQRRVSAVNVEQPRGESLSPAAALVVYFPKTIHGTDLFREGIKKAAFHCEYEAGRGDPKFKITVEFDLTKMFGADGNPDL